MTTYQFQKCSELRCSQEALFNFHLDPNNITRITPPDTSVKILKIDLPLQKGSVITLQATKFFIPQRWEVIIDEVEENRLIVDNAIKSPFSYWRHEHHFTATDSDTVILCDTIEFALPLGKLGTLLNPFVLNDLTKMFEFRHKKTKELLGH